MSRLQELQSAIDDGAVAHNEKRIWPDYCFVRSRNGVYMYNDENSAGDRDQPVESFPLLPGYDGDWRIGPPPFGGEGRQWCGSLNHEKDCPEKWSKAWVRQCMKDWHIEEKI